MRNKLPDEEEEEVKAYVVEKPEPFIPEADKDNRDVRPESGEDDNFDE